MKHVERRQGPFKNRHYFQLRGELQCHSWNFKVTSNQQINNQCQELTQAVIKVLFHMILKIVWIALRGGSQFKWENCPRAADPANN